MPKSSTSPSRTADQFVVRFPDGMRDRIAEIAKVNGRSMNAEIVARLDESFETSTDLATLNESIKALQRQIAGQRLDTLTHRTSAIGVSALLKNLVDQLEPSIQQSGHPFAKTLAKYRETAEQILKDAEPKLHDDLDSFMAALDPLVVKDKPNQELPPKHMKRTPKSST